MFASIPSCAAIRNVAFPPKDVVLDTHTTLAAINRQQTARIIRAVAYIFATVTTAATMLLTEGGAITWSIAAPLISIALISWVAFLWLNRLDDSYLEGLDENKRKEIASAEFQKLLCHEKINALTDDKTFITSFENINKILGCKVISDDFIEQLIKIRKCSTETKTLQESAEEQGISMALTYKGEMVDRGWFGRKTTVKKVELQWSGKREDLIQITNT